MHRRRHAVGAIAPPLDTGSPAPLRRGDFSRHVMKRSDHARAGPSTAKVMALRRVLVVAAELHTALYVDEILRRMGIEVIGPVGTLRQAMILAETERLDAALLDVRLHPDVRLPYCDRVYPVADLLRRRKVPFCVMTASAAEWIDRFRSGPVLLKPFHEDQLKSAVCGLLCSDSMGAAGRPRRVGRATGVSIGMGPDADRLRK